MDRWYVAQTHSHAESQARAHLERQGFRVYLPQYTKRRRHARRTDEIRAPLFPGYLFVCLDLARERWRAIRSTAGVRMLVSAGETPLAVPDGIVDDIRLREDASGLVAIREPVPFTAGDAVEITAGPMREQIGWFERLADNDRVLVLLNMLGRPVRMALSRDAVRRYC